jgi:hypothetical protein
MAFKMICNIIAPLFIGGHWMLDLFQYRFAAPTKWFRRGTPCRVQIINP